jgi:DNA repair protein RadD
MIQSPQVAELIDGGAYLVKVRAHAPSTPDLRGVRAQAGDYVESQLAGRTDRAKLIADSVGSWLKFGERCTLFCDGRRAFHSAGDEFIKEGGRLSTLMVRRPRRNARKPLARVAAAEIELNCMVLTQGWDMPEVGCCILARPTKKMGCSAR